MNIGFIVFTLFSLSNLVYTVVKKVTVRFSLNSSFP